MRPRKAVGREEQVRAKLDEIERLRSEIEAMRESATCHFRALELDPDYGPAHEALDDLEKASDDPLEASMQSLYTALDLSEVGSACLPFSLP